MAAFLPYDDETTPFEGNFLQTADDLNHLPPDLISPLPSYALYREPVHYLSAPKPRLNPFDRIRQPSSHQQNRQHFPSSLPPPTSSNSSLSTYSYNYPPIDLLSCREAVTDLDLPSPSLVSSAPSLISPGLQLYETTSTSSGSSNLFSRYSFPLTPPIDEPNTSNQSNSYLEWKACTDLPPPPVTASLASGVSASTLPPNTPSTFPPSNPFYLSPTSHPLPLELPPTFVSRPSPNVPSSSSSSSHLRRVISSGIARRRTRNPYLASPALSCSSIFPLTSSKARAAHGGGRSRLSRDEVSISCSKCNVGIATLQLRGKGNELDVDYRQDFVCFDCRPDLAGSPADYEPPHDTRVGYEATISAYLDREQGIETQRRRRVAGSSVRVRKASAGRRDPALELITCDSCRNDIASGGFRPLKAQDSLKFTIEVVCLHCTSLYRRCSDDGGGGGRLGVGKWRCKELFDEGRRNCSFSHARMGPIVDLTYDTHSLSTIHRDDLERLNSICFEFFRTSLLSALAVPDVLEAESPIAIIYDQIEKLSVDTWAHFDPFFRPDTATKGRRRYLGLRYATQTSRKKTKPSRKSPSFAFQSIGGSDQSDSILRPDLRLTGFTIMEVDEEQGLLFTPLSMPMGSVGDTYDASTTLLQRLSHHITKDCNTINAQRRQAGLAPNRPIRDAWTVVLFSKDTRGVNHLETRRGYVPLSKYSVSDSMLSQQIQASLDDFLPFELQQGWQVFARPYGGPSDDWGELIKSRRRRKTVANTKSRPRRMTQTECSSEEEEEGDLSDYVEESSLPRKRSKR